MWKSVGSQAFSGALLRVLAQGQTWQGPGWGWDQVPEGIKVSVPGNLSFPSEERGVSIPRLLLLSLRHMS